MRLKQQCLDGRCPGTKGTHALMHVYTKSFYSNSLFSLKSDLKSRSRRTHLSTDRKPRPLQKTEI